MGKRLVRDQALRNWVVPGAEHQVRSVESATEHYGLLKAKLLEEAGEVILAGTQIELTKELADVLAVLEAMAHVCQLEWEDVLRMADARELASGGFRDGLVWETGR